MLEYYQTSHIFEKTERWEAVIALRVNGLLPDWSDKPKTTAAVVFCVGILYQVFAVVFRLCATAFLISVLYIFRLVIPIVYIVAFCVYGVMIAGYVYSHTFPPLVMPLPTYELPHIVLPTFLLLMCLFVYVSFAFVVAKLYLNAIFDKGEN